MTSIKNFNLKKKIAAFVLAAVAVVVPVTSGLFFSNNAQAETDVLSPGDEIAFESHGIVLKDTVCVKRWHVYDYTLIYEGTYNDVFIDTLHTPILVTNLMSFKYTKQTQNFTSYNLSYSMSELISEEFGIDGSAKFDAFLMGIDSKITIDGYYHNKYEQAKTVSLSIAKTISDINSEEVAFTVNGIDLPYNHYYGDVLMFLKAYKFKLKVNKKQIAKYRKSALHKWSEYQIEGTPQEKAYYFYSSYYNNSGNYVRKTGDLGTSAEYERLISNAGK